MFIYLTGYNRDHCGREGNRAPVTFYAIYYQSDYAFTGSVQTFTAPVSGWYQIECWGGHGDWYVGGKGGYTYGEFYIEKSTTLYVVVGQASRDTASGNYGGWNGGGNGDGPYEGSHGSSGSGGGATDVRLSSAGAGSSNWQIGLTSRIIVAGGGGGGLGQDRPPVASGGHGGGWTGGKTGGSQTSGYAFGYGQSMNRADYQGGGGGWYGGYGGPNGGGGGSSYVSGISDGAVYTSYRARKGGTIAGGNSEFNGRAKIILIESE